MEATSRMIDNVHAAMEDKESTHGDHDAAISAASPVSYIYTRASHSQAARACHREKTVDMDDGHGLYDVTMYIHAARVSSEQNSVHSLYTVDTDEVSSRPSHMEYGCACPRIAATCPAFLCHIQAG